jgi:hypothetical protein
MGSKSNKLTLIIIALVLSGCSFNGSFKSAQAPDHINTLFVENYYNETPNGPPDMTLVFTELTKEYFQRNSKFKLVNGYGDAELQATVVGYNVTPIAPVGNEEVEVASQNRLTIRVQVRYTDNIKSENSFSKSFSKFSDFEAAQNLSDVESELVNEIAGLLIIDIFNAAYDNW